jgi:hypothetical protein
MLIPFPLQVELGADITAADLEEDTPLDNAIQSAQDKQHSPRFVFHAHFLNFPETF